MAPTPGLPRVRIKLRMSKLNPHMLNCYRRVQEDFLIALKYWVRKHRKGGYFPLRIKKHRKYTLYVVREHQHTFDDWFISLWRERRWEACLYIRLEEQR